MAKTKRTIKPAGAAALAALPGCGGSEPPSSNAVSAPVAAAGPSVTLNLQAAFLSPPMAMAAYYLKGVAPPQVTLAHIFLGMIPFMLLQLTAVFLLALFPQIGMWLPRVLYQ